VVYTLIGEDIAKEGIQFIAQDSEECKRCNLYPTCVKNLEIGRRYRIKEIKEKKFTCTISGGVVLVDVELSEIPLLVKKRNAIEGMSLKFQPLSTEKKELFNPQGLEPGDTVKIQRVLEPYDKTLQKVLVAIV
jgi:uncharacterized protein (UPF0179 family)